MRFVISVVLSKVLDKIRRARQVGPSKTKNKPATGARPMKKSVWISIAAIAAFAALAMLLPLSGQRAVAQSGGLYINAVDLDIVPAERDNYLAAIKENSLAAIQEPGCRQFDILVLADDPNHLFLYEVYDNEAAFKTHRASEHFKKYAALTASMVAKRVTRTMAAIGTNAKPH
jgi:(4S)-4-hydroxy-5-phosphonooxypentane-2,3-dione isomerase